MRIYLDQPNQGEPVIKKIREVSSTFTDTFIDEKNGSCNFSE